MTTSQKLSVKKSLVSSLNTDSTIFATSSYRFIATSSYGLVATSSYGLVATSSYM